MLACWGRSRPGRRWHDVSSSFQSPASRRDMAYCRRELVHSACEILLQHDGRRQTLRREPLLHPAFGSSRLALPCRATPCPFLRLPDLPTSRLLRPHSPDAEKLSCRCSKRDVAAGVEVHRCFAEHCVVLDLGPTEGRAVSRDEDELGCWGIWASQYAAAYRLGAVLH